MHSSNFTPYLRTLQTPSSSTMQYEVLTFLIEGEALPIMKNIFHNLIYVQKEYIILNLIKF